MKMSKSKNDSDLEGSYLEDGDDLEEDDDDADEEDSEAEEINSECDEDECSDDVVESDEEASDEEQEDYDDISTTKTTLSIQEPSKRKHVVFDDDETFEDLLIPESLAVNRTDENAEEEESDSDGAPEEFTIKSGQEFTEKENEKRRKEVKLHKEHIKETRKKRQQRNTEQQKHKRERLANLNSKRLSVDFLNAVKAEKAAPPAVKINNQKQEKAQKQEDLNTNKSKTTGPIPLERGVQVRALQQEVKKHKTLADLATEFRQNALYGNKVKRMSTTDYHAMIKKQKMSGRC